MEYKYFENKERSDNFVENNNVKDYYKGIEVVDAPKHDFKNIAEARTWAKENITGTYKNANTGEDISVSKTAINKYLSESAVKKSTGLDAHLSALKQLPKLIETSILKESKQDRDVNKDIKEIQRFYGAINFESENYPVKITVKAYSTGINNAYSYEVMEIENPTIQEGLSDLLERKQYSTSFRDENESRDKDTNISGNTKGNDENIMFHVVPNSAKPNTNEPPKPNPGEGALDYTKRITEYWAEQSKNKKKH